MSYSIFPYQMAGLKNLSIWETNHNSYSEIASLYLVLYVIIWFMLYFLELYIKPIIINFNVMQYVIQSIIELFFKVTN